MTEIRKLKTAEWISLIDTFEKVFDSDLPSPEFGDIHGVFENGKLEGFILLEKVIVVGQIYVKDEKRGGALARKLIQYARRIVPEKQSVAAVASETRLEMLYRSLGMQKIAGTFFRKN